MLVKCRDGYGGRGSCFLTWEIPVARALSLSLARAHLDCHWASSLKPRAPQHLHQRGVVVVVVVELLLLMLLLMMSLPVLRRCVRTLSLLTVSDGRFHLTLPVSVANENENRAGERLPPGGKVPEGGVRGEGGQRGHAGGRQDGAADGERVGAHQGGHDG